MAKEANNKQVSDFGKHGGLVMGRNVNSRWSGNSEDGR